MRTDTLAARARGRGRRRHHPTLEHSDRCALERAGWRTMLEYRENHIRRADGTLLAVETHWIAEAEHADDQLVATVRAATVDGAWAALRKVTRGAA